MRFTTVVLAGVAAAIAMLPFGSTELSADARLASPANQLPGLVVPVTKNTPGRKCIVIAGEEFCLVKSKPGGNNGGTQQQNGGMQQDGGAGNNGPQQDKPGAKTETTPGERSCPEGYVVLSKPNKFGSFCEPAGGLCPKGQIGTPPDCKCPEGTVAGTDPNTPCIAKLNCPFPEMTGNSPDCKCPEGTAFDATKGCIKLTLNRDCKVFGKPTEDPNWYPFMEQCVSVRKSKTGAECQNNTEGNQQFCCCTYYTE